MMKNNEGFDNDSDRISDLPDCVIHCIFKFLDTKYAVQTCVLSKRWRYVWKSLPFLYFNSCLYLPNNKTKLFKGFNDFVDKVLLFRDDTSNIQSFFFTNHGCPIPLDDIHYDFKTWILTALRSNVEDLDLSVSPDIKSYRLTHHGYFHQLPHECLFSCKSLRILKLNFCFGDCPTELKIPDSMSLPRLKTLVLRGFRFEYSSNNIANKIFSSSCCPVLESLSLSGCVFNETGLDISAPQLKHLEIENYRYFYPPSYSNEENFDEEDEYPIKLYAPNLISFDCKDHLMSRDYSIENLSALVKAEIGLGTDVYDGDEVPYLNDKERKLYSQRMMKFLRALHNVETLAIRAPFLYVVSADTALLESTHIQFCNIRCLKLRTWLSRDCINSITYILRISPNIETLFLDIIRDKKGILPIYAIPDEVRFNSANIEIHLETEVSLHHLKDVTIRGAQGRLNEFAFLEILLKKAMVLKSVTLYTPKKKSPNSIPIKTQSEKIVQQLQALPRAASSIIFTVV
ncbi:F-box domain [Macleaya cordata]|uniref:F-box domain n=1 Tax=Macleaya cordata TaxID=56857 RepID=A0A200QWN2_MACCD|nr:F-box domain [Macleaya cordata]